MADLTKVTIAFDIYGTLINTHGLVGQLQKLLNDDQALATAVSQTWRDKQLEYSFRRGLMNCYVDFSVITKHALDYSLQHHQQHISQQDQTQLLEMYRTLPAFDDVSSALLSLQNDAFELYAFSNGSKNAVATLLESAEIHSYFKDIISVESLSTFKPNPTTYNLFVDKSNANLSHSWLVSSNPFDVIGAISAGMKAAWVQRTPNMVFDPWGIEPTIVINDLSELKPQLLAYYL